MATESLAVVIPVYQGASSLEPVVDELVDLDADFRRADLELMEILLVHDGAIDDSATVLQELDAAYEIVRPVWLSRNFGQHAATLAGCASSTADWIVTMDEDGIHDPRDIVAMVRKGRSEGHDLVYGTSAYAPHSRWRAGMSRSAKWLAQHILGVPGAVNFSSFRLMDGRIARALAAYCGQGVYLDVAALWVFSSVGSMHVRFRDEIRAGSSGYDLRGLVSHLRRLTVTAGARPLRLVAFFGLIGMAGGLGTSIYVGILGLTGSVDVPGWASVMAAMTALFGLVLLVIGTVAEYLSAALETLSGRPPYLITGRPPRSTRRHGEP